MTKAPTKTPNKVPRDEKGRLLKGHALNPSGKPKGATQKITGDMKAMLEHALEVAGGNVQKRDRRLKELPPSVAYLADQAEKNPQAFMGLLRSLLPAKIDLDVTLMSRDLIGVLSERRDQLAQLRDITPEDGNDARH